MTRILVVDDEAGIREFLVEALERRGWSVDPAVDGRSAIDALAARAYDVVLTDLKMPGLDGMEVLRFTLKEQPSTQVVLMTAHGTVDTAVEAMKLGAYDYLQKPISGLDELRVLVQRAAERKQHLLRAEGSRRSADDIPPLSYGDPQSELVAKQLAKVAATEATVLLTGESGTGKEIAARTLHAASSRAGGAFVALNCAAVTDTLLESELFGHEKGAFTGATAARVGRIELAAGGTLFLDEIGELKTELQAKLLRVLQERTYERVGGVRTHAADVRWIAATNQDLEERVGNGAFREDLFHRLAVFPVHLPPLRERRADIRPLAERLLRDIRANLGRTELEFSQAALRKIEEASWPGNVRELSNTIERAAILAEDHVLDTDHLLLRAPRTTAGAVLPESLEELEQLAIQRALEHSDGNRERAAKRLGIGLRTLYDKLKRYNLS